MARTANPSTTETPHSANLPPGHQPDDACCPAETRGCGSTNPLPGGDDAEVWLAAASAPTALLGGEDGRLAEDSGDNGEEAAAVSPAGGDRGDVGTTTVEGGEEAAVAAAAAAATHGTGLPVMPAAASSPDRKPS